MSGMIVSSVVNAFSSDRSANTQADAATQAANTQAASNSQAIALQRSETGKRRATVSTYRALIDSELTQPQQQQMLQLRGTIRYLLQLYSRLVTGTQ
jgi:hypothetical protein